MIELLNCLYKNIFLKCFIHKNELFVWSYGDNKYNYGLDLKIECPECHPELFATYIKSLERFDIPNAGVERLSKRGSKQTSLE